MVDKQPEVLAHHSTQAGFLEKAVDYWHRAGQRAIARSAISEAITQLTTGLDVLRRLPDSEHHARRELDLQVTLGDALRSAKRYGEELDLAYRRARELCEQLGEISQLVQVVYGQEVIAFNAPNVPTAAKFADELLRIAREHKNSAASVLGEQASGTASFTRGNFSAARFHLKQALASSHRVDLAHAQYPVISLTYLSLTLFVLGYPDQARDAVSKPLPKRGRRHPLPSPSPWIMPLPLRCCDGTSRRSGSMQTRWVRSPRRWKIRSFLKWRSSLAAGRLPVGVRSAKGSPRCTRE
jgi:hypothetical protein